MTPKEHSLYRAQWKIMKMLIIINYNKMYTHIQVLTHKNDDRTKISHRINTEHLGYSKIWSKPMYTA